MEFVLGTLVHTRDGRKIGKVDRVVLQTAGGPVQAIVTHKGIFFTRDVLVPIERIERVNADGVYLDLDEKAVDNLPDFIEEQYAFPPAGTSLPAGFTMGAVMYPLGVEPGVAPFIVEEHKHLGYGQHDIARGFTVRCTDGDIGAIRDVLVDGRTNQIEAILVETSGPAGTVRVPVELVEGIEDEVITLACTRGQLEAGTSKS